MSGDPKHRFVGWPDNGKHYGPFSSEEERDSFFEAVGVQMAPPYVLAPPEGRPMDAGANRHAESEAEMSGYKLPCADCVHLSTKVPDGMAELYMSCDWSPETPFWLALTPVQRTRAKKAIYGPHDANAKMWPCPARLSKPKGSEE